MVSVLHILLFSVLASVCASQAVISATTHEVKQGHTYHLCGKTFVHVWKMVCRLKYNPVSKKKRARRSINEMIKPRTKDFISSTGALQFLNPKRIRRQVLVGGLDNANEECCKEGCSYAEVAEYRC